VFNLDTRATGDQAQIDVDTKHTAFRVSAGHLDRSAAAQIVLLEDGGYLGFASDVVRVFGAQDNTYAELGSASAATSTSDILAGDIDGDQQAEILVLEGGSIEVFGATSPASPTSSFTTPLTASVAPTRLALADLDGDSPVGTLSGDPELVAGPVVPVSVLVYPPYSATHSDGTSVITVGNTESKDQSSSTTVTLNASAMIGYEFGISGIAKASVFGLYGQGWGTTKTHSSSVSIGDNFSVKARPEVEGPDNGVAVLACACFHAYTYQIDDPAGKLGDTSANGKKMSVFVPVGGQTALWSLKRYNALAAKLGSLPVVNVPYTVGDPSSYPTKMQTLAGQPIPAEDLLYTTPKSYRTSDVANVAWTLGMSESNAQAETTSTTLGLRAKLKAGPVEVELNASETSSSTLSVNVGKSATFSGTVPPIRNLDKTPEDENALYSFGFSPVVYRDHYTAADGSAGGLYVVTYAVDP
jgi:hypothetical protein